MVGKFGPVLVLAAVAMLLPVAACSADATLVGVSYGDFMQAPHASRQVTVPEGTSVDVSLYSNRTSGFQWEVPYVSDETVLEHVDSRFTGLYDDTVSDPMLPGKDVFAFQTIGEGQTAVEFRYSRPWEGGQTGVWTFTLVVNVE